MSKNKRFVIDCRKSPGSDCSVAMAGEEEEVLDIAMEHAVKKHGYPTDGLREKLRSLLQEETAAAA